MLTLSRGSCLGVVSRGWLMFRRKFIGSRRRCHPLVLAFAILTSSFLGSLSLLKMGVAAQR